MDPHSPSRQISNHTSASSQTMLNDTLAPYKLEALEEPWQIFLVVLYSLTAIMSFALNIITVVVLARYRHSELRKYLINLSVSDLLMSALSIPFTYTEYMLGRWIFASFLCPLVKFVVTISVFVSVATMTVIGINRHLAIMYPLKKENSCCYLPITIRKSHVIAAIWLLGIAVSAPEYMMHKVEPFTYDGQSYVECRPQWPDSSVAIYTVFLFTCTLAIPLTVLSILYARIGLKLWHRRMPGNVNVNMDLTMRTTRVKVIKMLFMVVILFALFWLPAQTFFLVVILFPGIRNDIVYQSREYNIFVGSYFFFHWLSMFHSCLNPLVYCYWNEKFKTDLHDLLWNRGKVDQTSTNHRHLIVASCGNTFSSRISDSQAKLVCRALKQQQDGATSRQLDSAIDCGPPVNKGDQQIAGSSGQQGSSKVAHCVDRGNNGDRSSSESTDLGRDFVRIVSLPANNDCHGSDGRPVFVQRIGA